MEAFLRNVPRDLSEDRLKTQLLPVMNTLGIRDWYCEKSRWKNKAWVVFLNESDGNKFLARHEKRTLHPSSGLMSSISANTPSLQSRVPAKPRLHILGVPVFVEKSTRKVDKHVLSILRHSRDEKKLATTQGLNAPALTFRFDYIACGDSMFDELENYSLNFVPLAEWAIRGAGKFGPTHLTIGIDGQDYSEAAYRMDIPYDTIYDMITTRSTNMITLVLVEPPRLYAPFPGSDKNVKWMREKCFQRWPQHSAYVATALVYQIRVFEPNFDILAKAIKSRDLFSVTRHELGSRPKLTYRAEVDHVWALDLLYQSLREDDILPFGLLFQIQALVWNNYLRPHVGFELLVALRNLTSESLERKVPLLVTTDSMKQLFQTIPYPCPGTDPMEFNVHQILDRVQKSELVARKNDPERDPIYGAKAPLNQMWVFKATVTPTRILLNGPDAESRNRVLRMFPNYNDYFLRVTFCDEDGQDLTFQLKVSKAVVYDRYREVLKNGIDVAGRKFSFLGFSHSSLRSHSVWFSTPFRDESSEIQTYETILRFLGDFSEIRVPAKCAARIGQAFSETPYAIPLSELGIKIRSIPDVKNADGSRVFSDGVGTISWDALKAIWSYLSMQKSAPTCIQIRMGGYKGILSLDSRLKGNVICVRSESMMKFPSKDLHELGICDTASKPLRLFLNRQVIKILEDMGTSDEWFVEQQTKALRILKGVTATAINTSTFLRYQSVGISMGLPKLIKQLHRMGIDYRRDNFLRSVVEHIVLRELRLLKHKARIPVDKGITLFGTMDETGFLEEGQVYITYDKTFGELGQGATSELRDGEVLVTRSPALHPGDIQTAQMITPPAGHPLRKLKNCIVFSRNGSRDLPSQLSGGDLDGDLYNVIWDSEAMPKWTFAPADYPRVSPRPLKRPVTRGDMADFFIDFMKTDVLGMIAIRHVVVADKEAEGTVHPSCLALAGMHSTAVDFSKTGIPVDVKSMPKPPRGRPDFLAPAPPLKVYDRGQIDHIGDLEDGDDQDGIGPPKLKYYYSEKILGTLYRNIDEKNIWDSDVHREVNTDSPSVWDQMLGLVGAEIESHDFDIDHTRQLEEARNIRDLYETTIHDKMWHFSESPRKRLSEVEVFLGFILNKRGSQTRRQRDSSIKLKEDIDRYMAWIVKLIRNRGISDDDAATSVTGSVVEDTRSRENTIELCWACVVVGCEKRTNASSHTDSEELESFPVVAACCLLKELNILTREMQLAAGGGYVGIRRGKGRQMILPMR